MKKNNNRQITSISNNELQALMKERFGIDINDFDTGVELRMLADRKKREKEDVKKKPVSSTETKPSSVTTTERRMSQGDKGFIGGLITAAGIWLLSKAGAKPQQQPQVQPLTADEEFEIVEKHLMRDAYLRHISRQ